MYMHIHVRGLKESGFFLLREIVAYTTHTVCSTICTESEAEAKAEAEVEAEWRRRLRRRLRPSY